jgi:hypothetical protein
MNEFDSRTGRLTLFTYLNTLGPGIPDMLSGRFPCIKLIHGNVHWVNVQKLRRGGYRIIGRSLMNCVFFFGVPVHLKPAISTFQPLLALSSQTKLQLNPRTEVAVLEIGSNLMRITRIGKRSVPELLTPVQQFPPCQSEPISSTFETRYFNISTTVSSLLSN